jgi:hypothetical protein
MTAARVAQEGSKLLLRLALPEDAMNSETWQKRLESAYNFQRGIQTQYLQFCDPNSPRDLVILGIGYASSHSIILRAVRPIHCNPASVPPRIDSPWILQLAVNILRHSDRFRDGGDRRLMPWVPWHALAVALAGLCSIRGTDLANEAWKLIDRAMAFNVTVVADSRNGLLWKPLERLWKKAAAFRDQDCSIPPSDSIPPQDPSATLLQQQPIHPVLAPEAELPLPADLDTYTNFTFDPEILMPDAGFTFSADMLSSLPPADASWFDWENMVKEMDDPGFNGMVTL